MLLNGVVQEDSTSLVKLPSGGTISVTSDVEFTARGGSIVLVNGDGTTYDLGEVVNLVGGGTVTATQLATFRYKRWLAEMMTPC